MSKTTVSEGSSRLLVKSRDDDGKSFDEKFIEWVKKGVFGEVYTD